MTEASIPKQTISFIIQIDIFIFVGTISCAVFHENGKYLFTGSEDHKICILKSSTWSVEKTLLKHQGTVTDISVHPSGKLALSVGQDHKLITWNLIKGRSAYVTNVKEAADFVRWSPEGKFYAVGFYQHVDVYDVSTASVLYSAPVKGRSNAAVFLDEDTIIVAGDCPNVGVHSISRKRLLHELPAHQRRVRCLHLESSENKDEFALVTASNDGLIKIWRGTRPKSGQFKFEAEVSHDAKCRITCLAVHKTPEVKEPPKVNPAAEKNSDVIPLSGDQDSGNNATHPEETEKIGEKKRRAKPMNKARALDIEAAAENPVDKFKAKRVRVGEKVTVSEPRNLRQQRRT